MKRHKFKFPWGGSAILYHGDCIQGMWKIAFSSFDVVITSPPYNIGAAYSTHDDSRMSRDDYLAWLLDWSMALEGVMHDQSSLFLNVGSIPTDPWVAMDVARTIRDSGHFVLQNTFHWIKSITIETEEEPEGITYGHYKPINSPRFVNDCHEFVFHFTKTGRVEVDRLALGVPYMDESNRRRWTGAGTGYHCRGNTWFIPYKTIQSRNRDRPHPATFPVELVDQCLLIHGLGRVRRVLDPFMGIGSTGVACAKRKLNFVGFDIDEDYIRTARGRITAAGKVGQ